MPDVSYQEQSAFNMGLAILFRIDKVLTQIAMSKLSSNTQDWYSGLFTLKGEVYYKLKEEERKEIGKIFAVTAPLINDASRKSKTGATTKDPRLIVMLEVIETKLKEYMEKRGMLGAKKGDPRYALAGSM